MAKKLQIFVSSTYTDLVDERQAAVEAILRAGHIPAGMELFAAGNESQMEIIRRWIDESDVYMLILGGRYGTVEQSSKKSYTQLEYEYAVSKAKPLFAAVLDDDAIQRKVTKSGLGMIERTFQAELATFRQLVLSKICRMATDTKDIKLIVHETMLDVLRRHEFRGGWLSGQETAELEKRIETMTKENAHLRAQTTSLAAAAHRSKKTDAEEAEFDRLFRLLSVGTEVFKSDDATVGERAAPISAWFITYADSFVTGISNGVGMSAFMKFLFYDIAPKLMIHDLLEVQAVPGQQWWRVRTSKMGNRFLARATERRVALEQTQDIGGPSDKTGDSVSEAASTTTIGDAVASDDVSTRTGSDNKGSPPGLMEAPGPTWLRSAA